MIGLAAEEVVEASLAALRRGGGRRRSRYREPRRGPLDRHQCRGAVASRRQGTPRAQLPARRGLPAPDADPDSAVRALWMRDVGWGEPYGTRVRHETVRALSSPARGLDRRGSVWNGRAASPRRLSACRRAFVLAGGARDGRGAPLEVGRFCWRAARSAARLVMDGGGKRAVGILSSVDIVP